MKLCTTCQGKKPLEAFAKSARNKDGRQYMCRGCQSIQAKNNRIAKRKSRNAYYWRNRESEIAKVTAWRARAGSRAKVRAANARYLKKNATSIGARKRAARLMATPSWADAKAIKAIYREAVRRTRETGIRHEVDHIVPLVSPVVCGLHVQHNLQVLTASVNRSKGNTLIDGAGYHQSKGAH